jgi:hypothetical protein
VDFEVPPDDPEEWTDEEWLAWLRATDALEDDDVLGHAESERPRWNSARRVLGSAGGQVIGSAMLGLANAIYGRRDEQVVIVQETSGDPPHDDLEVRLDPDAPERSEVIIRKGRKRRPRKG